MPTIRPQNAAFALIVALCLAGAASARAEVVTAPGSEVNTKLRAAMAESVKQLGELEPWQQKIFDEEAVPQFQRFIRDYRAQAGTKGGITADIDLDNLRNYLRFYAPKVLKAPAAEPGKKGAAPAYRALVYLRVAKDCEKCTASASVIKKLVKARIERRGLVPAWVARAEVAGDSSEEELTGKALDDRVIDLARQRGASAALVIQWELEQADVDSAHVDEKHFQIHSTLLIRDSERDLSRSEGNIELLENDSFENAAARLLTDAFTELGSKVDAIVAAQAPAADASSGSETWIEVSGIKSFSQYSSVRAQIQGKLNSAVEERKVAKGRAVFAVAGTRSTDELKTQLTGLQVETGNLGFVGVAQAGSAEEGSPAALEMEIR